MPDQLLRENAQDAIISGQGELLFSGAAAVVEEDLPWDLGDEFSYDALPDLGESSDAICQRTRARNPLTEVSIEQLEALLKDDPIEPTYDDDEAYKAFLAVRSCPLISPPVL